MKMAKKQMARQRNRKDQRPGIQSDDYGRREERGCIRAIKKDRPQEKKAGRRQKAGERSRRIGSQSGKQKMEVTVVRRG